MAITSVDLNGTMNNTERCCLLVFVQIEHCLILVTFIGNSCGSRYKIPKILLSKNNLNSEMPTSQHHLGYCAYSIKGPAVNLQLFLEGK